MTALLIVVCHDKINFKKSGLFIDLKSNLYDIKIAI